MLIINTSYDIIPDIYIYIHTVLKLAVTSPPSLAYCAVSRQCQSLHAHSTFGGVRYGTLARAHSFIHSFMRGETHGTDTVRGDTGNEYRG